MSEQITWVSQIVGADYLGLQNAGAEYLGPFFAKSGADYLGGQITFLVGQNTWAPPKVGGRIPGRGQKWGRIPGRGQKWGRLPGMIFLVFRPALLPRCRITLGAAEEDKIKIRLLGFTTLHDSRRYASPLCWIPHTQTQRHGVRRCSISLIFHACVSAT